MKFKTFKGKLSLLKNLGYLIILGIHTFLYSYFIYSTFFNYTITIISVISFCGLIILALYSFLKSESFYYYFYIGIIISSIPIIFTVYLSAILIVPEVLIIFFLLINSLDLGANYYKTKVNKKDKGFYHDPAISGIYRPTPGNLGLKMDEVWNPDSTIPIPKQKVDIEKTKLKMSLQFINVLLTCAFFICGLILVFNYYFKI